MIEVNAKKGEHICDFLERVLEMAVASGAQYTAVHNAFRVIVRYDDNIEDLMYDWYHHTDKV